MEFSKETVRHQEFGNGLETCCHFSFLLSIFTLSLKFSLNSFKVLLNSKMNLRCIWLYSNILNTQLISWVTKWGRLEFGSNFPFSSLPFSNIYSTTMCHAQWSQLRINNMAPHRTSTLVEVTEKQNTKSQLCLVAVEARKWCLKWELKKG